MIKDSVKEILAKVKGYFRENWGAPFILGFMMLLLVAAVSLAGGLDFLANDVAVYAYYLLVVGVVLQLISFLRGRGEDSERE
jgi:undecaprenyl pyrophosphate phosphatase UppP